MSRVRAEALVLVNWKGVFYARYELDRHVTALEGDNGSGKTTVMIGAYVVLLPDMTRLRFTNLGETGATGGDKGIWGRLGELGRPSYSALDFRLPRGERVIAGVHLERKGEPTVEPTPFLVSGLAPDIRLQELLLLAQGNEELVPELPELRENVARLGGRLTVFGSARDYFAALFELGIMPMRMATDEERNKLNEMLKTSMTGGMSRGLLTELRSFLLKEESGLSETLQRMRANLTACRRTRTDVVEAQRLEREIGSVYEAGEEMFAAAIAATRQRAEETTRRVQDAEQRRIEAEEQQRRAQALLIAIRDEVTATSERKAEADQRVHDAEARERRVAEALRWATEAEARAKAADSALLRHGRASEERDRAEAALVAAARDVEQANQSRERAAGGLADLQEGLAELHRRAAAHRRARSLLAEARVGLGRPDLDPDCAPEVLEADRRRLHAIDEERRGVSRQICDAGAHRAEHAAALAALDVIRGAVTPPEEAHEAGRAALAEVAGWRALATRRSALAESARHEDAMAQRQESARGAARALGLAWAEGRAGVHEALAAPGQGRAGVHEAIAAPGQGRAVVHEALAEVEAQIAELETHARSADARAVAADRDGEEAAHAIRALEDRAEAYAVVSARAVRVQQGVGFEIRAREDLERARATVQQRAVAQSADLERLRARREELLHEARTLLLSGGNFPPELLRARDDLTAELLAAHFDDVGLEEAAELEARLGPLAHALVVPDVEQATLRLHDRPEALFTVWLVAEDASLSVDSVGATRRPGSRDVVVDEREARRVTRLPIRPTLGRVARERRAAELKREAAALDPLVEQGSEDLRAIRALDKEADALLEGLHVWLSGDPAAELDAARRRAREATEAARHARAEATLSREQADELRPRKKGLVRLLPEAALLDPPEHAERAAALRLELQAAERAAAELARIGDAPGTLEHTLDALRRLPWSDDDCAQAKRRLATLDRQRDALDEGLRALDLLQENRAALTWTDAECRLGEQEALVPALKAQHTEAVVALRAAQQGEQTARTARDIAVGAFHEADARLRTARESQRDAAARLAETGIEDASSELLAEARTLATAMRADREALDTALVQLSTEVGRRQSASESAHRAASDARTEEDEQRKHARPAIDAWERLRPQAEAGGVLGGALTEKFQRVFGGRGSVNVWPRAQECRALLLERLRTAQGGLDVLTEVEGFIGAIDQTTGEGYLRAWMLVRDWLRKRLPARIAEVDEPLLALARLREHLAGLAERLDRQERELRGASEDIARGIEVQIRKAQGRVRRLNQHLEGIHFGSIQGIRVRSKRVDRMEQVLRALRTGEAQELLFQADMPIEEALAEIFARSGGGRTGGQRLLDYREYIHLQVEINRQDSTEWEAANPTRLSTGEAIGVGATLMMVVLTEWERDANLLRGRRSYGTMRFLFLDEANRLDQANLATVFDLCRTLDLQLLVAAPEVARAEGCTVFRLVRTRSEDGREEVLVSGRRVVGEA